MESIPKPIDAARIARRFKVKPGYRVLGSPEWNPARDRMTLAAVRKYDDENHRLILKESRWHRLHSMEEGNVFHARAFFFSLRKLGLNVPRLIEKTPAAARSNPQAFWDLLAREMEEKAIRREERRPESRDKETEEWKSGQYIYYKGDIVYFISFPFPFHRREGTVYLVGQADYALVTNVRL